MEYWNSHPLFPLPQRSFGIEASANTIRSKILNGLMGQRQRFPGQENYIDIHSHLNLKQFDSDREEIIQKIGRAHV